MTPKSEFDEIELWEKELESLQKDTQDEAKTEVAGQDANLLIDGDETDEERDAFSLFDDFLEEQDMGKSPQLTQEQAIKRIVKALEQVQDEVRHFKDKKTSGRERKRKTLQKKIIELEEQEAALKMKISTLKKELSELNSD
ncbi:MAG: hypothetical protein ACE5FY_06735 [Nitrospiria bacterium]